MQNGNSKVSAKNSHHEVRGVGLCRGGGGSMTEFDTGGGFRLEDGVFK